MNLTCFIDFDAWPKNAQRINPNSGILPVGDRTRIFQIFCTADATIRNILCLYFAKGAKSRLIPHVKKLFYHRLAQSVEE
jgi:hypothetical protein